jgi:transposase InsO family protein
MGLGDDALPRSHAVMLLQCSSPISPEMTSPGALLPSRGVWTVWTSPMRQSTQRRGRRRSKVITDSGHSFKRYPNLLRDVVLDGPDQGWISDITYVRLPISSCYPAAILDAYSYLCVCWSPSRWIDTRLTLSALERAFGARRAAPGLIHHSDQGVQYASSAYVLRLEAASIQISTARAGNPYENAKAGCFLRTLKMEEVYLKDYQDFEEAQQNIAEFIEEIYNQKRLHSSLGYLPTSGRIRGAACPECQKLTMGAVRKMGFTPSSSNPLLVMRGSQLLWRPQILVIGVEVLSLFECLLSFLMGAHLPQ